MKIIGSHADALPDGMLCAINFPVLLTLDEWTPDKRTIEAAGFSVRDLPLPVSFLRVTPDEGHNGAVVAGMMDEVTLHDNGVVSGRGWLLDDEVGSDTARLVKAGALKGNSVDLTVQDMQMEADDKGNVYRRYQQTTLAGTTVCPIPAFPGAFAEIPEDLTVEAADDVLVAAASAAFAATTLETFRVKVREPIPADLFANPKLTAPTRSTIEGQHVFGHIACWDTPHLGNERLRPPRSASDYGYFATGNVLTDAGNIPSGRLVLGGDHAAKHLDWLKALDHYAATSLAWADVAVGEDEHGIWYSGIVRPGTDDKTIHVARASALSGDWRSIRGHLELVVALSVNAPGFPIPAVSAYAHEGELVSLTGAGVVHFADKTPVLSEADSEALRYLANKAAKEEALAILAEMDD